MNINLTPLRLRTLARIAAAPTGMYVGWVADAMLTSTYRRDINSGYWPQMATRAGAGYCKPLIDAGLLDLRRTEAGYGVVTITRKGLEVVLPQQRTLEAAAQS